MVAITATAPRLTPTTSHRIQLCIYGSFKACQILLLSPAVGTVLFCHFIYCPVHANLCNVVYILGCTSNASRTRYLQVESPAAVAFQHSLPTRSVQAGSFFLYLLKVPLVGSVTLPAHSKAVTNRLIVPDSVRRLHLHVSA
jgi:hypothetical protein